MRARAIVTAELVDGRTRYRTLRSDPPLLLRPTPDALQLVGGAAGPLGGDDFAYRVVVGPGASLTVRSVAASMVLPGVGPSRLDLTVDVADGAHLDWDPRPLISVIGSRHTQHTVIRLAVDATLRWCETLVLGRSGESPGTLSSVLRIERAGTVLHHTELRVGDGADGWDGPAGLGGSRAVITHTRVGSGHHDTRLLAPAPDGCSRSRPSERAGVLRIDSDASVVVATGRDLAAAQRLLEAPSGTADPLH